MKVQSKILTLIPLLVLCTVSVKAQNEETDQSVHLERGIKNVLGAVLSTNTSGVFERLRCVLCEDMMSANVDLIKGLVTSNEGFVTDMCQRIFKAINMQPAGLYVCNAMLKQKIEEYLNKITQPEQQKKQITKMCVNIHLCSAKV